MADPTKDSGRQENACKLATLHLLLHLRPQTMESLHLFSFLKGDKDNTDVLGGHFPLRPPLLQKTSALFCLICLSLRTFTFFITNLLQPYCLL